MLTYKDRHKLPRITNSSYFVGPRRIFTKRPVDERYLEHSVQFGRYGRKGWLQVDSFANITGKAPGARENLNITSKVNKHIQRLDCNKRVNNSWLKPYQHFDAYFLASAYLPWRTQ